MSMQQEGRSKAFRVSSFARPETKSEADTVDRSGGAIISLLQQAADVAKADCDRAISTAHQLSLQLRAEEDRANKLQAQVNELEDAARKAEDWLAHIYKQIEGKFFPQKEPSRKPS